MVLFLALGGLFIRLGLFVDDWGSLGIILEVLDSTCVDDWGMGPMQLLCLSHMYLRW